MPVLSEAEASNPQSDLEIASSPLRGSSQ